MKIACLFVATVAASSTASADPIRDAISKAYACSDRFLERYAKTTEAAAVVAQAAYDACGPEWGNAATEVAREIGPAVARAEARHKFLTGEDETDPLRSFKRSESALRDGYVSRSIQEVLKLRSK